jgi:hypothetical protein
LNFAFNVESARAPFSRYFKRLFLQLHFARLARIVARILIIRVLVQIIHFRIYYNIHLSSYIVLIIMGIKLLSKLIADAAPEAIKEQEIASYFGRRIAIDASTCLYQFLVAIRMRSDLMVNGDGETTSHLIGFFHRTNKLLEVSLFRECTTLQY